MLVGEVVKIIDDKTVKVRIENVFRHKLYQKIIKMNKYYLCHCEKSVNVGDNIEIKQSRKFSKMKHYVAI